MRTLYFDCFSGISGDMFLGSLLDLGVDKNILIENLKLLNVDGYKINIEKKLKNHIMGTELTVILDSEHPHEHHHDEHGHEHRSFKDIEDLINKSRLSDNVKALSIKIFKVVAEAEAKIHGKSIEEVHFHEVGAVDSIVDIVGAAICIDSLKADYIRFSKLPLSNGFVKCQHGIFPLPAPAVIEILKGVPVYYNDAGFELVTPTGAAIVKALGNYEDKMNDFEILASGYGLGKKTYEIPNVLRAMLIDEKKNINNVIAKIEANIDDMTGEQLGYVMDKVMQAGALDVFFTNIYMKKNRPAVMVTALCSIEKRDSISSLLLSETSTFGIRYSLMERDILERKLVKVNTRYGKISFKLGYEEGRLVKYSPEYEDCKAAALTNNIPIYKVYSHVAEDVKDKLSEEQFSKFCI